MLYADLSIVCFTVAVYIFIHGRPLGSYDATLRQNNI